MVGSHINKNILSRILLNFLIRLLPKRFGYDMRRNQYSSLILTEQMSRDEALEKLKIDNYDSKDIKEDYRYVATKLGISIDELKSYEEIPRNSIGIIQHENIFDIGEKILRHLSISQRGVLLNGNNSKLWFKI